MNEDILKGKCLEIQGSVKEKWGKLTDNDLGRIEGKGEKLLGLLQKRYGYIREKAEPEYQDSVELAAIVSSISGIMVKMKDVRAIAFIARYGRPLLAKNQESQLAVKGYKKWPAHYPPGFTVTNGDTIPAAERIGSTDCAHPAADGTDLR